MDYRVACWATENLSAAGLRAWLRLVTYFRNDRPIPEISARRLAQITGLSVGGAHKVFGELRELLRFANDEVDESPKETAGDAAISPEIAFTWAERERARPEQQRSAVEGERTQEARRPTAEALDRSQREHPSVHGVNANRSQREHQTVHRVNASVHGVNAKCSPREHPSISVQDQDQEQEQEINPPPPTSSVTPAGPPAANPNEEEDRSGGTNVPQGKTPSSPPAAALLHPWAAEPHQGQPRQPDPRLQPVAEELRAYWAGKSGSRTDLAFAAQQAQLLQILDSPIGGIEEVRGQIATAAMKDWDLIRYQTWHDWRQKHPPPLLLQESDLNDGALFPGLKSFERRYRATYGQNSSSADVLAAFYNVKARLERERSLQNFDLA
ncbi:hypothetical protein KBZ33_20620 [Cyanobium sp. Cruz-8D1]|nr:hypothetical protein [Cyanobium sp. Cruz-8D1]